MLIVSLLPEMEDEMSSTNKDAWRQKSDESENRNLRKSIMEITGEETTAASAHIWCDPMLPCIVTWSETNVKNILRKQMYVLSLYFFQSELNICKDLSDGTTTLSDKCWNVKVLKWFNVNIFSSAMQHWCFREQNDRGLEYYRYVFPFLVGVITFKWMGYWKIEYF